MSTPIENNTVALRALLDEANNLPGANSEAVLYTPQTLTAEQQAQARTNIGALAESELDAAVDDALAQAKESGEFDGPQGPQGNTGPAGPAGSDATVTAANIKNALGYTPASETAVDELSKDIVTHTAQTLTDEQKAQARANIGAATVEDVLSALPIGEGVKY